MFFDSIAGNYIDIGNIPIYAHELLFEGEKKIGIKLADDACDHNCANCKVSKIEILRKKYPDHEIVYVGDGFTDILAAPLADIIFARNNYNLSKYLTLKGITHHTYNNLLEIKDRLIND